MPLSFFFLSIKESKEFQHVFLFICPILVLSFCDSLPRNKKKKIPLVNGEEVDMDLSAME